jgi:hypothetical protein
VNKSNAVKPLRSAPNASSFSRSHASHSQIGALHPKSASTSGSVLLRNAAATISNSQSADLGPSALKASSTITLTAAPPPTA